MNGEGIDDQSDDNSLEVSNLIITGPFNYRRFAASFADLRMKHRKLHGLRKVETIEDFEGQLFDWLAKPAHQEPVADEEGPHHVQLQQKPLGIDLVDEVLAEDDEVEVTRASVTMTGRVSGIHLSI